MGSTSEESENGIWVLVIGSITEVMVSDRVSKTRSPVNGEQRVSRADDAIVEVVKSK